MPSPPLTPLAAAVLHVGAAPERILEIESDAGDAVLFLAREFPTARVRGLDRDEARVRAATARTGLDPEGRVAFKPGSPRAIPYPSDFFDLVVLVDSPPPAREAIRVLRPGGYLILARSDGPDPAPGLRARLALRRLRHRGIEFLENATAGDGSFSVGRLRGDDPPPPAD